MSDTLFSDKKQTGNRENEKGEKYKTETRE
jgi:hypothetical protein